jgi:hypothetical protein
MGCSAPAEGLGGVDGNRPGLGFRRLGQRQRQDAMLHIRTGGVSNVDIAENNTLQIKAIGVVISTFETLPFCRYRARHPLPRPGPVISLYPVGESPSEEACAGKPQAGFCEGEAHNGAGSNSVTLSRPKGESNGEYKADLHTEGVLSTRPKKPSALPVVVLCVSVHMHAHIIVVREAIDARIRSLMMRVVGLL